ncbi:hypothetical protein [Wolbachia endosymbiont of Litomosoides brasiliensis]
MYLPLYSPELNPTKRLWLYIKQNVLRNKVYKYNYFAWECFVQIH